MAISGTATSMTYTFTIPWEIPTTKSLTATIAAVIVH